MLFFISSLFVCFSALTQTYEEHSIASQRLQFLDEKCKTSFTNAECNDERRALRGKLKDLEKIPEIKKRLQSDFRIKAWDNASAYCEKEEVMGKDQAMQYEISIYKPTLEKDRLRIDRKKFCRCRADRRLSAFGKEGAGSFYILGDDYSFNSRLSAETQKEVKEIEKDIFVTCFEQILAFGFSSSPKMYSFTEKVRPEILSSNPEMLKDYAEDGRKLTYEERFRKALPALPTN